MEELYQDQETIIQQLRLLLAAKEEELNKMRGMADSGGGIATGESVTDQLISELEEKKNEVIELRARMEDIETSDREKLSSIADELDEKDKIIASLQSRLSGGLGEETPTDPGENERVIRDSEAARAAEREETERRLAALEEQLEEKERLLGEARREVSTDTPDADSMHARIRILEDNLEEKDLSYRTVQAQLHRLKKTQQMLQGLCAGVGVFLICILSIKTKQPHTPRAEAASLPSPISLTESTADTNDAAPPPREIPAHTAKEPERHQAEDDQIQMEPVVQAAAPGAAGKADRRITYTVQKGDSLWLICKRMLGNGGAMARIARENNISDPRALKVGDVIYLSRK
jgi:nucleoid-associated protein YgaU